MAKGRKLTTSRSERYLTSSFAYNQDQGTVNGESELGEEDVWSVVDDSSSRAATETNVGFHSYMNFRGSPRASQHQVGGLSLAFDDSSSNAATQRIVHQYRAQDSVTESPRGRNVATSAPVNVPDWSKIYRVDSVESLHNSYIDGLSDPELVPPHEYLARSRQMAAKSVFEGVGRTLKGRDLSRVRDAVWSQTGFDG